MKQKRALFKQTDQGETVEYPKPNRVTRRVTGTARLWDCFDASLEASQSILLSLEKRIILLKEDGVFKSVPQQKAFKMAEDIEDKQLRLYLKKTVGIRALLFKHEFHFMEEERVVENHFGKTLFRLHHWVLSKDDRAFNLIQVFPLKGYEKAARSYANQLRKKDWLCCKGLPVKHFFTYMKVSSRHKVKHKFPEFSARERSGYVVPLICHHLIDTIKVNTPGIIEDIDTEFTHDFRIASRISRSILKQMKKAISPELLEKGQSYLSNLGKITNPLRDCDVYLLDKAHYYSLLPDTNRKYLTPFFQYIQKKRKTAWQNVVDYLESDDFQQDTQEWRQALISAMNELQLPDFHGSAASGKPIGSYAAQRIRKRLYLILEEGRAIHESTPDEALHELRISCKKLRYLLDVFKPLYDSSLKILIKKLKKLQTVLGDFNDLSVQQEFFKDYSKTLSKSMKNRDEVLIAIGMLLAKFRDKQMQLRQDFSKEFESFCSSESILLDALQDDT
ncbi:MAG: hypothetical protein CR997_09185 [Acidobacteria bacterium]|nr:MAG: hypothetical protein CR997_09185 [Acidobacteriota bacterium]